jgi:hypothetical protein
MPAAPALAGPHPVISPVPAPHSIEDLERVPVLDDLRATHSHKSRAAALLGLPRFQLYTPLKRHNIDVVPDEPAQAAFERNLPLRVRFRTFTFKVARSVCARYHRR